MRPLYLMSLSLVGILAATPHLSAQEATEAIQAPSAAFEPVAVTSHALAPDAAEEVQQVQAQPVAAEQRARGGAGNRRAEPSAPPRQGGNPRAGRAEPQTARRAPAPRQTVRNRAGARPRSVVVAPRVVYNNYPYRYAYSGRYLPSRRGVFGAGYLYYGPSFYGSSFGYGPSFGGYYRGYRYYDSYADYGQLYDIGELRLQVSPRHAQVFVDGDYAGTVDDFDGTFQSLKLESGSYAIRLEAEGYETMEFDVRITPRQKVTYREDLRRE